MASLAQMLMGGSALTQPDAPVVNPAPTFQPEDIVARQYRMADALRNVPTARSWAGVLANGLGAVGGNILSADANAALRSNQDIRKQGLDALSKAKDLPGATSALLGSQDPSLQNLGAQTQIKTLSDDPTKDYRIRDKMARLYGLQPGTQEYRDFVLTSKLRGVETELPSNIREWNIFSKMTPEQQQQYLTMKRADKYLDTGTEFVRPNPVNPAQPVASIPKNVAGEAAEKVRGKAEAEGALGLPKAAIALKEYELKNQNVVSNIDRALTQAGPWTTGYTGNLLSYVAGTPAHDLSKTLTSIKANLGFETLQQMRDSSPTGGALGQVTERELELLQSTWNSLEQSQSEDQFRFNLDRLKQIKSQFADLKRQAYEQDVARFGSGAVPAPETAQPPGGNTEQSSNPGGFRYIGKVK